MKIAGKESKNHEVSIECKVRLSNILPVWSPVILKIILISNEALENVDANY